MIPTEMVATEEKSIEVLLAEAGLQNPYVALFIFICFLALFIFLYNRCY